MLTTDGGGPAEAGLPGAPAPLVPVPAQEIKPLIEAAPLPAQPGKALPGAEEVPGWVRALAARWPGARAAADGYLQAKSTPQNDESLGANSFFDAMIALILLLATGSLLAGESAGMSWLVGVLVCWPVCCVGGSTGSGDPKKILLALLPAIAHLVLIFTVGGWTGAIMSLGLVGICYLAILKMVNKECQSGNNWTEKSTTGVLFVIASFLTVLPAAFISTAELLSSASTVSALGSAGIFVFIATLWTLGWAFLWHRGVKLHPVESSSHLRTMPPKPLLRLKLLTVALECFNYCGFSFFPALPWKAMEVPNNVPHPQTVMLAGLVEFEEEPTWAPDLNYWTFVGAAVVVPLSFASLFWTSGFQTCWCLRRPPNPPKQALVTQICFDLLAFPLIKKLTSVFSCTSVDVWQEIAEDDLTDDQAYFGCRSLEGLVVKCTRRFCETPDGVEGQCMDNDPEVQCWGGEHRSYLFFVFFLLVPYYVACLHMQATSQARQSVVKIDGGWSVVSTQTKFMLAIIASTFGGCYPIGMVVCVLIPVLGQLLMLRAGTVYSNVHSLNAIRFGGLMAAAINSLYAVFIVWSFRDDPAGKAPCSTDLTAAIFGDSGSGSDSAFETTQAVSSFGHFFGLLAANLVAIGSGASLCFTSTR